MKPVIIPNLPHGHVRLVAISETATDVISALSRKGIEVVSVSPLQALSPPVASHSDLQMLHLGGNNIVVANESEYLCRGLTKFGFTVGILSTKLGEEYPQDISLNFLILNSCCFGMLSIMPLHVKKHCIDAGLQVIDSKQGYARCSVAVLSQNAAITSDTTLYKLLTAAQIDTLLVGSGDILLQGYDTGFIGGCCGLIDSNKLAFTGSLEQYRYGMDVLAFLYKHNISPIYLTDGKLLDIGGILPLMEEG